MGFFPDIPDSWLAFLGVGGGYGVLRFLEFVLNWLLKRGKYSSVSRKDLEDSLNKDRAMLRQEMAELKAETDRRLDEMRAELDSKNRMILRLERDKMSLERENKDLRGRYHRFMQFMQDFMDVMMKFAERIGIPEDQIPHIPRWDHEDVIGPTSPKPPTIRGRRQLPDGYGRTTGIPDQER